MARKVTLFTGQWADLKLKDLAKMAADFGYDGLELACWGDHMDAAKGAESKSYCEDQLAILEKNGLGCWAISSHLAGQLVCDSNSDDRSDGFVSRDLAGNAEGKREWRRIVPLLIDLGLYTDLDYAALAMYCQAYGRWVQAERTLAKQDLILTGAEGGTYQNPMLHVANKAWEQMRKILAEFGLTPSSRSRLQLRAGDEPSLAEVLFNMAVSDGD